MRHAGPLPEEAVRLALMLRCRLQQRHRRQHQRSAGLPCVLACRGSTSCERQRAVQSH